MKMFKLSSEFSICQLQAYCCVTCSLVDIFKAPMNTKFTSTINQGFKRKGFLDY